MSKFLACAVSAGLLAAMLPGDAIDAAHRHLESQVRPILPASADGPIWGRADDSVLGECSAAVHDQYVVGGGDGYSYRTWHPQVDASGCVFAHEHGDDPARVADWSIAASPVRFGYVGRRLQTSEMPLGHDEPHEGFKVFVARTGELNDERRRSLVDARIVFHMGTGGAARFSTRHHSMEVRVVVPGQALHAFTQLMGDTGGVECVSASPRQSPVKTVVTVAPSCRLDSLYEIWSAEQSVRSEGRRVYTAFATPAVFDPITAFDPSAPRSLQLVWALGVEAVIKIFPEQPWREARGCNREAYMAPGKFENDGNGRSVFYTDPMGEETDADNPLALVQEVSPVRLETVAATNDGLGAFKLHRSHCSASALLGLKN